MQEHYSAAKSYKLLSIFVNMGFWVGLAIAVLSFILSFILPLITKDVSIKYDGMFDLSGDGFALSAPAGVLSGLPLYMVYACGFIYVVLSFLSLLQLKNIVNSMRTDPPFTQANAWRLHIIGICVLGTAYIRQFVNYFYAKNILEHSIQSGGSSFITPRFELLPSGVFFALCLFVLAEVFKYGCILQHEHDTTV